MADQDNEAAETPDGEADGAQQKKKGLMGPIMIGLAAAVVLGAGAAFAVMSGLAPIGDAPKETAEEKKKREAKEALAKTPPPVFVAFEPLTITVVADGAPRQLRLQLSLETTEPFAPRVEEMRPRVLDALNTMLRAMNQDELTEPSSLDRLRAQMLRRIRIATDPTAVKDLLITEFVIF